MTMCTCNFILSFLYSSFYSHPSTGVGSTRHCPKCHRVNPPAKKRCTYCEEFLVGRACPACGTLNHNRTRECFKCKATIAIGSPGGQGKIWALYRLARPVWWYYMYAYMYTAQVYCLVYMYNICSCIIQWTIIHIPSVQAQTMQPAFHSPTNLHMWGPLVFITVMIALPLVFSSLHHLPTIGIRALPPNPPSPLVSLLPPSDMQPSRVCSLRFVHACMYMYTCEHVHCEIKPVVFWMKNIHVHCACTRTYVAGFRPCKLNIGFLIQTHLSEEKARHKAFYLKFFWGGRRGGLKLYTSYYRKTGAANRLHCKIVYLCCCATH